MTKNILSRDEGALTTVVELDLNALYHPAKARLTASGIFSAMAPLFGFGWAALTQDPESRLREELRRRIRKERTDLANLTLILQLAALCDCHHLRISLPMEPDAALCEGLSTRLPHWRLTVDHKGLTACHMPPETA
ncbi:hypothetical protein ACL00X_04140 [Aeromonas diversa]|uniref:hypothetical protein n=1 Tax=Aeromonas diversa TaxID=502790 RepID=UPI0039A2EFD8